MTIKEILREIPHIRYRLESDKYKDVLNEIEDILKVTSVTPQEQKTGHWISEKVDGEDWKGCKRQYYQPISCSKCHSPNHYKSAYCPNCGAKMIEPQESEIHCNCTDAEMAKSFIEDVEAVKELLPHAESEG